MCLEIKAATPEQHAAIIRRPSGHVNAGPGSPPRSATAPAGGPPSTRTSSSSHSLTQVTAPPQRCGWIPSSTLAAPALAQSPFRRRPSPPRSWPTGRTASTGHRRWCQPHLRRHDGDRGDHRRAVQDRMRRPGPPRPGCQYQPVLSGVLDDGRPQQSDPGLVPQVRGNRDRRSGPNGHDRPRRSTRNPRRWLLPTPTSAVAVGISTTTRSSSPSTVPTGSGAASVGCRPVPATATPTHGPCRRPSSTGVWTATPNPAAGIGLPRSAFTAVPVPGAAGAVPDTNELAGSVRETVSFNGDGGPADHATVTDYWVSPPTARRARAGLPDLTASYHPDRVHPHHHRDYLQQRSLVAHHTDRHQLRHHHRPTSRGLRPR